MAVIIARVTYLLAIGEHLRTRRGGIAIPVYLGDSLQWNVKTKGGGQIDMFAEDEVTIYVPPPKEKDSPSNLDFPRGLCEDPAKFDAVIDTMLGQSEAKASAEAVTATLKRKVKLPEHELATLETTYKELRKLKEAGRNHIWGYVARNLSRPIWLSSNERKADVIVGNPPWLSFRYMDAEMQRKARDEMKGKNLWVGGKLATHQDLSGLFFARAVELYMKRDGLIAFVMPLAALTRGQFE
ncbi:MAG: Eco57I restriction-modification methylase domain-containing protein, partial [Alphaproteobacteria bacterium]